MKTLTGSTLDLSFVKCNEKYKGCPREFVLGKPEIHFLVCATAKPKNVSSFSCLGSSQRQRIRPVFSSSAVSSKTHLEDEQMQILGENQCKTVQVKFRLQKECSFGQHFFIVGDDPIFGLWDPLKAIPLNWSDGHVWTVELDIPIGKLIKYKFLLKGDEEAILWQPGEDRVIQTRETTKMITVIEDWDDSEIQKIIEGEEPLDSDLLMVAENITQSTRSFEDEVNNGRAINGENLLLHEEEFPVLVPGMIQTAEADVSLGCDKAEVAELNMKEEAATETSDHQQTIELILDENQELQEDQHVEEKPQLVVDEVLEGDLQWGRKTLQKFLINFGILK